MPDFTLSSISEGQYNEKGSTFSAIAIPVSSAAVIKNKLSELKEQFPDASHICYGYRIKEKERLDEFATDASEPNGSAGQPILNALKRNHLVNTVIFVIRYFGGSKLGIPGLIHAYGKAAECAIEVGKLKKWFFYQQVSIRYSYDIQNKVDAVLQQFNVNILKAEFGETIKSDLEIEVEKTDKLSQHLSEISNGEINVKQAS